MKTYSFTASFKRVYSFFLIGLGFILLPYLGASQTAPFLVQAQSISIAATKTNGFPHIMTTLGEPTLTVVTPASSIRANRANTNWEVVSDNGNAVTARGVVYSTSPNPTLGSSSSTSNGSGIGIFSSTLTGLTPNTTYYARAYATNANGTGYSSEISFKTLTVPPVVSASAITSVGFTASWAPVTGADDYRLYVWRNISLGYETGYEPMVLNSTSYTLTDLEPNTLYHFRVNSYNGRESESSNIVSVLTLLPAPTATPATSVTATGFTANWDAMTGADSYELDVATDNSFTTMVAVYTNISATSNSQPITGLQGSTTYYYRVRAVNASGASANSNIITVTTPSSIPVPIVHSPHHSPVGTTTATLGATIGDDRGSAIIASGIVYSTSPNPTLANSVASTSPVVTAIDTRYTLNVTGLASNTRYYYRGYATNAAGTGYFATDAEFVTLPGKPTVQPVTVRNTTSFTVDFTTTGTETVTYFVHVSTDPNFSSGPAYLPGYQHRQVNGSSEVVTGIDNGATYYIKVMAVNSQGQSVYSDVVTSVSSTPTYQPPVVHTPYIFPIGTTTATLGAIIGDDRGSAIIASGVVYDTVPNPYLGKPDSWVASTSPVFTAIDTRYTVDVTGLFPNTRYYYRGYAVNGGGPGYFATDAEFVTLPGKPTVLPVTARDDDSFVASFEIKGNQKVTYFLHVSTDPNFGSAATYLYQHRQVTNDDFEVVTGINSGATYYIKVMAVNSAGASVYSDVVTSYPGTPTYSPPVLNLPVSPFVDTTIATLGATIVSDKGDAITASGVVYSTSPNPTRGSAGVIEVATSPLVSTNNTAYTVPVSGLAPNTRYYYRGYATNRGGDGYSPENSFYTLPRAPIVLPATGKAPTSFVANWDDIGGTEPIQYYLYVYSDAALTTFVPDYNHRPVNGTSEAVTGLTSGAIYYYRVKSERYTVPLAQSNFSGVMCVQWLDAPIATAATIVTPTDFRANWLPVNGATAYRLDVSTSTTFASFVPGYNDLPVNGTSYTVTGLNPNTTYYYRVRAVGGCGVSDHSNTITVQTISGGTPLPVTLVSFTATAAGSAVQLQWKTATEQDHAFFIVERSRDGRSFTDITRVAGSGTTSSATSYKAVDTPPASGLWYYRLRLVSDQGEVTYSKQVSVQLATTNTSLSVYPNPATNVVHLSLPPAAFPAVVQVVNVQGAVVLNQALRTASEAQLDVIGLANGTYQLVITTNNGQQRQVISLVKSRH